jgi:AcrR family transcriptional regulator
MAGKRGRSAGSAETTDGQDVSARIRASALTLAAERAWSRVGLGDIAAGADLTLAELHRHYRSKEAILAAFWREIDATVLAGGPADSSESARERLFDMMMRRFDALKPHRAAVAGLVRALPGQPGTAVARACGLLNSMGWMLEAAGISAHGPLGLVRRNGLAVIYLATLRVWLEDTSEDMGRTMAALDRHLKRAEMWATPLAGWRRRRNSATDQATATAG